MVEEVKQNPQSDVVTLMKQLFHKFLMDACQVLGGNPTRNAQVAREHLEIANLFAGLALNEFPPPQQASVIPAQVEEAAPTAEPSQAA